MVCLFIYYCLSEHERFFDSKNMVNFSTILTIHLLEFIILHDCAEQIKLYFPWMLHELVELLLLQRISSHVFHFIWEFLLHKPAKSYQLCFMLRSNWIHNFLSILPCRCYACYETKYLKRNAVGSKYISKRGQGKKVYFSEFFFGYSVMMFSDLSSTPMNFSTFFGS